MLIHYQEYFGNESFLCVIVEICFSVSITQIILQYLKIKILGVDIMLDDILLKILSVLIIVSIFDSLDMEYGL